MKVSFDIDGVLANFGANVAPIINEKWPNKVPADPQPNDWYYTMYGLTREDWGPIFDVIKKTPNFWRREPAYKTNVDSAIRFIHSNPEVTVYFMTQRPDTEGGTAYDQTLDWLVDHNLYPFDKEVTTPIIVKDPSEKAGLMKKLEIDFSIDDKQETVTQCNSVSGHRAYLLDRPWNQISTEPRVYTVDHFTDIIKKRG
jgi:hypothetical protein